jgi:hypothetical protein
MRSTTYETSRLSRRTTPHFTTTGFVAAIVGKWRQYRMMRDIESLPYTVMKDIGFRAAEQTNAK